MEDQRFSIVRANQLFLGPRRGRLGTLVSEKNLFERYTLEKFKSNPVCMKLAGGVCAGVGGEVDIMSLGSNIFEYCILGAGQTILAPALNATGLLASLDLVNDEGAEYSQGILASSKQAMVIGTDAFFLKCKFSIATVGGTDDCAVGFRKVEAYGAAIDDYDDMAVLNVISGDITIETIIGDAATVPTDTLDDWADGETHTLEVYVSRGGVVTYKIDGVAPTTIAAFTFTDALTVIPFFYFLHDVTTPGEIILQEWECGLQ